MITPYNWQVPSVEEITEIIRSGSFGINASDTGTGKTVVSLQMLKNLDRHALVVCPKAVHTAWERTAAAMDCSSLIHGIVNPERLQYKNPFVEGLNWKLPKDTLVIWDEVHKGASGPKSKTTKILAATKPQGIQVLAMSATIATSPLNMRAVGYLAGLHRFNPSSYWGWCLENGCYRAEFANRAIVFPKGRRAQELMKGIGEKLRPMMTRIRVADVPEFPETVIVANLYDLEAKYLKEIEEAQDNLREALKNPRKDKLTERLRAREVTELCKVGLLVDLVMDAVEADKSVVVFVNFRSTLAELKSRLTIPAMMIHGDQKDADRTLAMDSFQGDLVQVLLCMTQAGGVGISLHGLPGRRERVSFITPNDNASDFVQALGRIHRAGGSKSVQTIVLAAGTVEETIHRNIQGKLENLSCLTDADLQGD